MSDNPNQLLPCTTDSCQNPGRSSWQLVENDLLNACGACHDLSGSADAPFLAGPDRYRSFVSWPGIVAANPNDSRLLTFATGENGHPGPNLDSPRLINTLLPKVKTWLADEAKNFSKAPPDIGRHIEPFMPILGFNAVYLDALGPEFAGMAVTFNAKQETSSILDLALIEVHPTVSNGLRITHPVFVVHPIGRAPDPVEGLNKGEQIFAAGASGSIDPGMLVVTNWSSDAKLSLAFEKIEIDGPSGAINYGCKDLNAFTQYALALLSYCHSCHDGTNPQARAAVDMSGLYDNDPISVAKACGQIRNRVTPDSPPDSVLFITTDPVGNATHPYKFKGSTIAFDSFRQSITKWIEAER